uniref:Uncharacterized protein n=1 Tax=Glossina pallidipes TaxID=7398 RepID=A0A1A9ZGP4_GLOPL
MYFFDGANVFESLRTQIVNRLHYKEEKINNDKQNMIRKFYLTCRHVSLGILETMFGQLRISRNSETLYSLLIPTTMQFSSSYGKERERCIKPSLANTVVHVPSKDECKPFLTSKDSTKCIADIAEINIVRISGKAFIFAYFVSISKTTDIMTDLPEMELAF